MDTDPTMHKDLETHGDRDMHRNQEVHRDTKRCKYPTMQRDKEMHRDLCESAVSVDENQFWSNVVYVGRSNGIFYVKMDSKKGDTYQYLASESFNIIFINKPRPPLSPSLFLCVSISVYVSRSMPMFLAYVRPYFLASLFLCLLLCISLRHLLTSVRLRVSVLPPPDGRHGSTWPLLPAAVLAVVVAIATRRLAAELLLLPPPPPLAGSVASRLVSSLISRNSDENCIFCPAAHRTRTRTRVRRYASRRAYIYGRREALTGASRLRDSEFLEGGSEHTSRHFTREEEDSDRACPRRRGYPLGWRPACPPRKSSAGDPSLRASCAAALRRRIRPCKHADVHALNQPMLKLLLL